MINGVSNLLDASDDFESADTSSGLPVLSRRALFGGTAATVLAMGGMMLAPKVPGGVLFSAAGPERAYAASSTSSFKFTVVGADEVGFQILDASGVKDVSQGTPVKDAEVVITSRLDGTSVKGTTDKEGKVILSIASIAADKHPVDGVYHANVTISVKSSSSARVKMRDFSAGIVALEGATGVIIGTHKTDSTDVYMERCTFDDWDIHYSKITFLRSEANDIDHTILIRVKGVTADASLALTIMDSKKEKTLVAKKTTTAKYDSSTGLAEGSFTAKFLYARPSNKDLITEDDVVLRIDITTADKKTFTNDIELLVEDTPIDDAVANAAIIPFTTSANSLFNFSVSGDWPCFNGLSFGIMSPSFPLQITTSLVATSIGLGTDIRMLDDNGKIGPKDAWKKDHMGNVFQRYKNLRNKQYSDFEAKRKGNTEVEMYDLNDPNPKGVAQKNDFLKFDFNVIARFIVNIRYNGITQAGKDVKTNWIGGGTGEVGLSGGGSVVLPFEAGPVPMYVAGSLNVTAIFGFTETVTENQLRTVRELDVSKLTYTFDHSLAVLIKIALGLSIGVGYKGLCSFSFDGTFEFPFYFGWLQAGGDGKENPHITIGVTILLEFVFQCLLFRLSGQVYSYSKPDWYNNWPSDTDAVALTGEDAWAGIEPRFRLTQPDGSFRHSLTYSSDGQLLAGDADDPFAGAVPTTNAMMMGSREADAKRVGADDVDEIDVEAQAARFVPFANEEGVFVRDDGTRVYTNKIPMPVVLEDGSVGTELVDCEGVNTFLFGEAIPEAEMSGQAADEAADETPENASEKTESETQEKTSDEKPEGTTGEASEEAISQEADNPVENSKSDASASAAAAAASGSAAAVAAEENSSEAVPASTGSADATSASEDNKTADDEQEMKAQAEPAVFEGDPLLGFALGATAEYTYEYVEGKTTGAFCGTDSIRGIAAHNGVLPSVDAIIYKDVHSDPRQRVVSINGVPYLFRVVTIAYPSGCRSRVVASAFDLSTYTWGEPKVIEYNTGDKTLPRVDMYDYEFDIVVRTGDAAWAQDAEACLIVTGGLRPNGDSTSFYDAASNPTLAIVLIDGSLSVVDRSVRSVSMYNDGNAHMIYSPCIVDGFAPNGASGALAYAFMHRAASNKLGLARGGTDGAKVTFSVGYCYVRDDYLSFPKDLVESPELDATVFGIKAVAGDAVKGKYDSLLTVLASRQDGYDVLSATIPEKGTFKNLAITHCVASNSVLPEIQPWPHHGTFLFVKNRPATPDSGKPDSHLYEGAYTPDQTGQTGFTENQMDANGFKGASFTVSPTGNFIFYYESYRDKPDDDPVADYYSSNVSGSGDDTMYHIMASRLLNGKFSEDFPFCEVDHPIDHIEVLSITSDASAFVATHIKNADQSLADLHYIAVPNTLAAEIEGFSQVGPFVYAGHDCPFQIDVRNHGNLIIGGFDVQMLDPDRGNLVVDTVHVGEIEPKSIMLTAENLGWGSHGADPENPIPTLTAEEEKGMLMPGKRMSYQDVFKIPGDWEGEKRVIMRIINAWTPGVSADEMAGAGSADGEEAFAPVFHFYHEGMDNILKLHSSESESTLYDPVETVSNEEPDNPDNPDNPVKPNGNTMPNTGDPLGLLGPLGVALGGLGALAAGYSARRTQIEREQQENEEA